MKSVHESHRQINPPVALQGWEKEAKAHLLASVRGILTVVSSVEKLKLVKKLTSKRLPRRSSSSDLGTEDTDLGARKKSTSSTDGKTPHRTPSRSHRRKDSLQASCNLIPYRKNDAPGKTSSPYASRQNKRRSQGGKRKPFDNRLPRRDSKRTSSSYKEKERIFQALPCPMTTGSGNLQR